MNNPERRAAGVRVKSRHGHLPDAEPCCKASAFFLARRGWFDPRIMHTPDGRYDVMLRLDGTYEHDVEPEYLAQVRAHFIREIRAVLDEIDDQKGEV